MRALKGEELLDLESWHCFQFFWEEANGDAESPGYGLIRDRAPGRPDMASIASVGFGLTALTIGVERGWVSKEEAYKRALGTLTTMLNNAGQRSGFFYHFLDMNTAKQYGGCEISVIDTAIFICGALQAGEYFGSEIKAIAQALYERIDWNWYCNPETNQFHMGFREERGGHFGKWDHYAEQFMMYFLGAASPTHPVSPGMFYAFDRYEGYYGGYGPVIHSTQGSLFVYQFSHAWFDLRGMADRVGIDWFENSVQATLANRQYCIDLADKHRTFGPNSWGLTACDGPRGYSGAYGAEPNTQKKFRDGTIPPCGAAGSIVFAPEEAIAALEHFYNEVPELWGKYGFKDAYNLDETPAWFASDVIGIDKGITLLMIENCRTGFVWESFMKNPYIQEGMRLCGLQDIAERRSKRISAESDLPAVADTDGIA